MDRVERDLRLQEDERLLGLLQTVQRALTALQYEMEIQKINRRHAVDEGNAIKPWQGSLRRGEGPEREQVL